MSDTDRILNKLDELHTDVVQMKTLLNPPGGKSLPTRVEELERFQWKASGVLGVFLVSLEGLWHWLAHRS